MICTALLALTIVSYTLGVIFCIYGIGKLIVNILVWSKFYGVEQRTENDFICFDELGQYILFWNLSVALPILYITMSILLFVALARKKSTLLSVWMIFWYSLVMLNLGIHMGFTIFHCSMTQAGILTLIYIFIAVAESLSSVVICTLWWHWVRRASPIGRLSDYMEELAGKHWRRIFDMQDQQSQTPAQQGSQRLPISDDKWIVKYVPLDSEDVRVIKRKP